MADDAWSGRFEGAAVSDSNYRTKHRFLNWVRHSHVRAAADILRLVRAQRVLDVGCADGAFRRAMGASCGAVFGIEIATAQIAALRQQFRHSPLALRGDVERLPFSSKSFDAAVCLEVLEHIRTPAACLDEVRRVLRPGAPFVVTVPIEIGLGLAGKQVLSRVLFSGYREVYTWRELYDAVARRDVSRIPHEGRHRGFDWRSVRALLRRHFRIERQIGVPFSLLGTRLNSQVLFLCRA